MTFSIKVSIVPGVAVGNHAIEASASGRIVGVTRLRFLVVKSID
jgi:hypothetical protein